jgi:hypothetical protein
VRQVQQRRTLDTRNHSHAHVAIVGTRGAQRDHMRSSIAALVLLTSTSVFAGSHGGSEPPPGRGGSSGPLGHVSKGIGDAAGGGGGGGQGGARGSGEDPDFQGVDIHPHYDTSRGGMYQRVYDGADIVVIDSQNHVVQRIHPPDPEVNRVTARLDLFLGLQKVIDSNTAFNATAAITDDWFRLTAYGSRYWEDRMDGNGKLTMTMGGGTFGFPVQIGGRSAAYLEGGVVLLKTSNNPDPDDDSAITGGKVGLHLEQGLRKTTIVGDAHALLFEAGIRAFEGRLGVRYGKLEGAIRVLDFNVGPALYGPELGVAF